MKASGDHVPDELKESWEFTSNQAHRVEFESKEGKSTYRRVESHPLTRKASARICSRARRSKSKPGREKARSSRWRAPPTSAVRAQSKWCGTEKQSWIYTKPTVRLSMSIGNPMPAPSVRSTNGWQPRLVRCSSRRLTKQSSASGRHSHCRCQRLASTPIEFLRSGESVAIGIAIS